MRTWILTTVLCSTLAAAHAQEQKRNTTFIGNAGSSCGKMLEVGHHQHAVQAYAQTIQGIWSGLNLTGSDDAQRGAGKFSGAVGIVADVRKVCSEKPDLLVVYAVQEVWRSHVALNR